MFLLVDEADHITGLTGATPTVTISKNGGSFAAPAGAVTEVANGWYQVAGHASDSDTIGSLVLHATAAGADPCDQIYEVIASPIDALAGASDTTAIKSVTDILNGMIENSGGNRFTEKALEEAPAGGGGGATPSEIAEAVHDYDLSGYTDEDSAGYSLYRMPAFVMDAVAAAVAHLMDHGDVAWTGSGMSQQMLRELRYRLRLTGEQQQPLSGGGPVSLFDAAEDTVAVRSFLTEALAMFFAVDTGQNYGFSSSGSVVKEIVDAARQTSRDWTEDERQQIRYRLGVDGGKQVPMEVANLGTVAADVIAVAGEAVEGLEDFNEAAQEVLDIKAKTDRLQFDDGNHVRSRTESVSTAGLAQFVKQDTGETVATPGSVAHIAQGSAGGTVLVGGFTPEAIEQLPNYQGNLTRQDYAILNAKARNR